LRPSASWGLATATLFVMEVAPTIEDPEGLLGGIAGPEPKPSPAAAAGLQSGDRILAVDGAAILRWTDVLDAIKRTVPEGGAVGQEGRPLTLSVVRAGARLDLALTPRVVETVGVEGLFERRPMLGFSRQGGHARAPTVPRYASLAEALPRAARETLGIAKALLERFGELATGRASVRASLGGPVEMVRQGMAAAAVGPFAIAQLMGFLSISLGIANLLPMPVLDGGHLLFLLLEGIRGRPISPAIRERALQAGVTVLVVLTLLVLLNDISRCLPD